MVTLGVGKNMVRSIRFWSQVAGMVAPAGKSGGQSLTRMGSRVLGQNGIDPFLEDIRTLWLIHWNLSTNFENPLLAWDYLLNRWQEPEIVASAVIRALQKAATKQAETVSPVTVAQHFDAFLHTYVPTRGRKGEVQEDNLDCPLVELELIVRIGERELDRPAGKREPIYSFRFEEKPDITSGLFIFCLNDFWQKRHKTEATLPLREVAHGHGSPGHIFKLPEDDIRTRLEELEKQTDGFFSYAESTNLQQVRRSREQNGDFLDGVYEMEAAHV